MIHSRVQTKKRQLFCCRLTLAKHLTSYYHPSCQPNCGICVSPDRLSHEYVRTFVATRSVFSLRPSRPNTRNRTQFVKVFNVKNVIKQSTQKCNKRRKKKQTQKPWAHARHSYSPTSRCHGGSTSLPSKSHLQVHRLYALRLLSGSLEVKNRGTTGYTYAVMKMYKCEKQKSNQQNNWLVRDSIVYM